MIRLQLRWAALVLAHIMTRIAAAILAPTATAWFASEDRRHLRWPFRWMETLDWDMAGDPPWRAHRLIGDDPLSWLNRTRWLWRNGAQTLTYTRFGVAADRLTYWTAAGSVDAPELPPYGTKTTLAAPAGVARPTAYYRNRFVPLPLLGRGLKIMTGWKLNHAVAGRHKLVCSVRLPRLVDR